MLACELIDVGFRRLATEKHPDKPGGDTRTMQQLNALRDWLKATVNATV